MIFEKEGYEPVECDKPIPCPFCGTEPELKQLAHTWTFSKRKKVRVTLLASSTILKSDTFWFCCPQCEAHTGPHCKDAQKAVEYWNRRYDI